MTLAWTMHAVQEVEPGSGDMLVGDTVQWLGPDSIFVGCRVVGDAGAVDEAEYAPHVLVKWSGWPGAGGPDRLQVCYF